MAKMFIPDKKLYSAVMFARKILQNDADKTFETACKIAANYYKLSFADVFETAEKYQNALAPTKGKKFKYFTCYCETESENRINRVICNEPHVCRAIDEDHCYKIIRWIETHCGLGDDIPVMRVPIKEYATKADAEKNLQSDFRVAKLELQKIYGIG